MRSNIPLWKYTTAAPAPLFGVQNVSVEYLRSLSGAKYIFVRRSVFFGYELKLLISTAGGRFPRAWLEPPCASHYGVSRLMLFPQESPPSVPINDAVLQIMNKLKRLWFMELTRIKKGAVNDNLSQQMEYARLLGEMRPR